MRARSIVPVAGCLLAIAAGADRAAAAEILVKLRHQGPHAVLACAQAVHERGAPLAEQTRDGSSSLDRVHLELGVRRVRAMFRRPDGRPLAAQRQALRSRFQRVRPAAALSEPEASLPELAHVYRIELGPGNEPRAAAARYAADPHVEWAQANFAIDLDGGGEDPFLFSSGAWGQDFADLWGIHRVRAPEAWSRSRGEGVIVAVVDTGVDFGHPDLADNAWVNPGEDLDGDGRAEPADRNGIDDDGNGFIDDLHGFDFANSIDANDDGDYLDPEDLSDAEPNDDFGHGTHIAGTIAAVADNGLGVAGVAPRARIMALKGFTADGSGTIEVLSRAMVYAILNGARVINNSWSCSRRCPSNPLAEEVTALARELGVVVVTSAGNRSDDVVFFSPENRRSTIVVGATDPDDAPASFTNTGLLVDVVAPGAGRGQAGIVIGQRGILSTLSVDAGPAATGFGAFVVADEYLRWSGTSMSAPHVAGVAALLLSQRPELGFEDVRGLLRSRALDLGAPGPDAVTGMGLVDAVTSLDAEPPAAGARFDAPGPGANVAPSEGGLAIRGEIRGAELAELHVGLGADPQSWQPVPLSGRLEAAGELARWDTASVVDGPYVLRLRVRGRDGVWVSEFRPFSLERNPPQRISPPELEARRPAISGPWVAWEGSEADEDDDAAAFDTDIFAIRWGEERAERVLRDPERQHGARLSGRRLAWLSGSGDAVHVETCSLSRRGACQVQRVSQSDASRSDLALRGSLLAWTEGRGLGSSLHGCRVRGWRCSPLAMPTEGLRPHRPILGRGRLSWLGDPFDPLTCLGFPDRCEPVRVDSLFTSIGGGDELLTLVTYGPVSEMQVCRPEADGSCAPVLTRPAFGDAPGAVSGLRVVWSGPGPAGDGDIYFCDFDPRAGSCPAQRITGSAAEQSRPAISGARVVWEDDREGLPGIFGLELPWLAPLRDRRVSAGRLLVIPIRSRAGSQPLTLRARLADGSDAADLGVRVLDRGDGRGWLLWRPRHSQVGRHVIQLEGVSAGGLVARRSLAIEVVSHPARPRPPRIVRR